MTTLAECAGMRTHGLTLRLHPILLNLNLLWCSRKHGKKLGLFSCHVRKTRPINFSCQARKTNLLFFLPCEEDKYIIFLATWGRLDLFFLPCEGDFLAMWMKIQNRWQQIVIMQVWGHSEHLQEHFFLRTYLVKTKFLWKLVQITIKKIFKFIK